MFYAGSNEVDVYVEISKHANIKYEYDEQAQQLRCDRILHSPLEYIFNYGFVPYTLSLDNDALDVVILMNEPLTPGCLITCKIVGCLQTSDEEGEDPKLIVYPVKKIDPTYDKINDIDDIESHTLAKVKYFFEHYKDLEKKQVDVGQFCSRDASVEIYQKCIERYKEKNRQNSLLLA